MALQLFDRKANAVFGRAGETGVVAKDLRIKFKIEKSLETAPNKALIEIYNLNPDSRARSERQGNIITLNAGYGKEVEGLFIGDVRMASTEEQGSDYVTKFECGDGQDAYENKTIDVSFGAGADIKDVFTTVTNQFGLGKGEQTGITSKSYVNGFVASGSIRTILDNLTSTQDLEWSIQDGQLQITKKNTATQQTAIVLDPESGLISIPKAKDKGYEIQALLQPKFKPGRAIYLKSKVKQGVFRILKVTHEGDTHAQQWYSTLEVE